MSDPLALAALCIVAWLGLGLYLYCLWREHAKRLELAKRLLELLREVGTSDRRP